MEMAVVGYIGVRRSSVEEEQCGSSTVRALRAKARASIDDRVALPRRRLPRLRSISPKLAHH
jgi:hypothetical protein